MSTLFCRNNKFLHIFVFCQGRGERQTIWQGILEWIEKTKNPSEPQKVTRHVPCQVSSSAKDGETEMFVLSYINVYYKFKLVYSL